MPPETTLTSTQILWFAVYTLITIIGAGTAVIFGRVRVSNMGEKVRNEAMAVINTNFSILLEDTRTARKEVGDEREKRARLEERVDGLLRDMDKLRERLNRVESEKKALEAEKEELEKTIDFKSVEYQKLMVSIQSRIDSAVDAVRIELTEHYEPRIAELNKQIQQKNEEITLLKSQLEEKSHDPQSETIPIATGNPESAPDPTSRSTGGGDNPGSDSTGHLQS